MKILMLPSIYGGVSWWRFDVPATALRAAGIEVTCPNFDEMEVYLREYKGISGWLDKVAPEHDLIHTGYTGVFEAAKAIFEARDKYHVPVIVDIDDDLDTVPPYNPGWKSFFPGAVANRIAKTQLLHADGVTFSTPPLAESLGYLAKGRPSTVLENWIDVNSWDQPTPPERSSDESIRLMVTGGNGRFGDWAILKEPLEWAINKYDGRQGRPMLRLFFIGATPDWVLPWISDKLDPNGNRCFYLQPTANTGCVPLFNRMVRYVAPDIIVSATQKNAFNRSKSGLKFFEAALAGATFICTDYDTHAIAPSDCCIKVDNSLAQWQWGLEEAITKPQLRSQLAEKARSYVVDFCDAKDHITNRISFYREVLEGKNSCLPSPPQAQVPAAT